ncbi:hypothetical protein BDV93DRAFT_553776 [Ceratobasidium sp. AG-I]|nr:hypothetical protein BDV93DRAFT_553776 [Ceratobasidium sp. AG-I]
MEQTMWSGEHMVVATEKFCASPGDPQVIAKKEDCWPLPAQGSPDFNGRTINERGLRAPLAPSRTPRILPPENLVWCARDLPAMDIFQSGRLAQTAGARMQSALGGTEATHARAGRDQRHEPGVRTALIVGEMLCGGGGGPGRAPNLIRGCAPTAKGKVAGFARRQLAAHTACELRLSEAAG